MATHDDLANHDLLVTLAPPWLEQLGYQIFYRFNGWSECLLTNGRENWMGSGVDEKASLQSALSQAFPSAASRIALLQSLRPGLDATTPASPEQSEEASQPEKPTEIEPTPSEPPAAAQEPDLIMDLIIDESAEVPSSSGPRVAPEVAALGGMTGDEIPLTQIPDQPDETKDEGPQAAPELVTATEPVEPTLRPRVSVATAVSELAGLEELIRESEAEFALLAPERQRIQMQFWACEARAYQEIHRGQEDIFGAIYKVILRLDRLAKAFWPGTVNSLREHIEPDIIMADHALAGARPTSWWEARNRMEAEIVRLDEPNLDEYGWADSATLSPAPNGPEGRLAEIRTRLEKLTGPLHQKPDFNGNSFPKEPTTKLVLEMVELAKKLRWLRLSAADQDLNWGQAMGRVRAIAAHWRKLPDSTLPRIIDPRYSPPKNWAAELGIDPERKKRRKAQRNLLQEFDASPAMTLEALTDFVRRALEVFDNPQLAALLKPVTSVALEIPPTELEAGNLRRRLKSIKSRLQSSDHEKAGPDATLEEIRKEASSGRSDDSAEDLAQRDAQDVLLEKIRIHTQGKRALLVSNRKDEELAGTLKDRFGLSEIVSISNEPRRLGSTTEAIAAFKYDFVLEVTGFLDHSTDSAIAEACRKSRTRLVRIGRGRPAAAMRAMGRALAVEKV